MLYADRTTCITCGADLSVIRISACCEDPRPSDRPHVTPDMAESVYAPVLGERRSAESMRLKALMDSARDLREMYQRGEITREEYYDHLDELRRGPQEGLWAKVMRFIKWGQT